MDGKHHKESGSWELGAGKYQYGKPYREEKIDSRIYKQLIKGYEKAEPAARCGRKRVISTGAPAGDLSLARFGMRNGRVCSLWLSYSE